MRGRVPPFQPGLWTRVERFLRINVAGIQPEEAVFKAVWLVCVVMNLQQRALQKLHLNISVDVTSNRETERNMMVETSTL